MADADGPVCSLCEERRMVAARLRPMGTVDGYPANLPEMDGWRCACGYAALREPAPPVPVRACINCGETNEGGYMTPDVGPFCSTCWHQLGEALSPSSPPETGEFDRVKEARAFFDDYEAANPERRWFLACDWSDRMWRMGKLAALRSPSQEPPAPDVRDWAQHKAGCAALPRRTFKCSGCGYVTANELEYIAAYKACKGYCQNGRPVTDPDHCGGAYPCPNCQRLHYWGGNKPVRGECDCGLDAALRQPVSPAPESREALDEWGDAVAAIAGCPGPPPAEAIDRLIAAGDALAGKDA
jgi:hypothetical protein